MVGLRQIDTSVAAGTKLFTFVSFRKLFANRLRNSNLLCKSRTMRHGLHEVVLLTAS